MKLFHKHKPVIIFSVYQHKDATEDARNHVNVLQTLVTLGVPHKTVLGRFKGKQELSFVVPASASKLAQDTASEFNQSSILYLDEDRDAYLQECGYGITALTHLGHFVPAAKYRGQPPAGDYTQDPDTGIYYEVVS